MIVLMRAMIVQPMAGKTDQEIREVRKRAEMQLRDIGYMVEDTVFDIAAHLAMESGYIQLPLMYLGQSLIAMSRCHAVYFCEGWQYARGCIVEHEAAKRYGLKMFYEEDAHG